MSAPRVDRAQELVEELRVLLDGAELDQVLASMDAKDVDSGSRHGIVLVSPSVLTFPTWSQVEVSWEVHIIAGPPDNYLAAWSIIDGIIDALAGAGFPVERAEPGQFQPLRGAPLWAYTLYFTESTN